MTTTCAMPSDNSDPHAVEGVTLDEDKLDRLERCGYASVYADELFAQARAAIRLAAEVERLRHGHNVTKPLDAPPVCCGCGGPHPFDTTIPSPTWNRVIRARELPEYLCTTCIVRAFAEAGESFTAALWGGSFNGLPVDFIVNGKVATTAHELSEENTQLRAEVERLTAALKATGQAPMVEVATIIMHERNALQAERDALRMQLAETERRAVSAMITHAALLVRLTLPEHCEKYLRKRRPEDFDVVLRDEVVEIALSLRRHADTLLTKEAR